MKLFKERISKIRQVLDKFHETDAYKEMSHHKQVRVNCDFLKRFRHGDYLIKVSRKNRRNYYGESNLYIGFCYDGGDWFSLMNRRNAQWFTGKEAQEWIRSHKGFTIVRR